jgi:hypothetical protein
MHETDIETWNKQHWMVSKIRGGHLEVKSPLIMHQKCYQFLLLKNFYFWFQININLPYTWSVLCSLSSVGNGYNYSDLVFCMEVKILLCLFLLSLHHISVHWAVKHLRPLSVIVLILYYQCFIRFMRYKYYFNSFV